MVRRDMYANSSMAPREAAWQTWCEAAKAMKMSEMPLTHDLVIAVGALFKAGGCRSAAQYFGRARAEHVNFTNSEIPPNVLLLIPKVIRSIERGMGAGALKDGFKVEDLGRINLAEANDGSRGCGSSGIYDPRGILVLH